MKIYTKTGDQGETGLYGGGRVRKDAPRIEAYGTVDELNAVLGLVRAESPPPDIDLLLAAVQNDLFDLGAELATLDPAAKNVAAVGPPQITALEQAIDRFDQQLAPLRQFILPGGAKAAAALHVARTVCRRAERRVIRMSSCEGEPISQQVVIYLNRLSDLLFVLARAANAAAGKADVAWQPRSRQNDNP
jgi:cob(I)alamin adenosyltransferase